MSRYYLVLALLALAGLSVTGLNLSILLRNRWAAGARGEAIRRALGASAGRMFRERLVGMGTVFGGAGLVGLVLGFLGKVALAASWPHTSPTVRSALDPGAALPFLALFFLLAVALPGLRTHEDLRTATGFRRLLAGGERLAGRRYPEGLRLFLPSLQIGLSLTLLMGSSLLLQGALDRPVEPVSSGSDPATPWEIVRVHVERTSGGAGAGAEPWKWLLDGLEDLPEVAKASLFTPGAWTGVGTVDGAFTECGDCVIGGMWVPFHTPFVQHHVVSPDSFSAMGLSLVQGREFTDADGPDAPLVAVVNQAYAREHFDQEGPLGRSLGLGGNQDSWHTVVGVVEDFGVSGVGSALAPGPAVYLSSRQHPPDRADLFLALGPGVGRASGPEEGAELIPPFIESGGSFRVDAPVVALEEYFAHAFLPFRWFGRVSLALGILTLALAAFGLYAILDYSVSLRSEEMGVRRALGATRRDVAVLTLGRSGKILLLGLFLGLEGSLFLTSFVEGIAFEGEFFDLPLFCGMSLILTVAALAGALRPTFHATRVPPRMAMGGL
jgi:hypothetical protein